MKVKTIKFKSLTILYSLILLAYTASVSEFRLPDDLVETSTELIMLIASLVIMFYIDKLRYSARVFWVMNVGASLLYLGSFFDFSEEFFTPNNFLDNAFEDIIQTAGFLIIGLGIKQWIDLHCDLIEQLHKTASTDHMTGLLNRRAFYQHIETVSPQENDKFSFLIIDIDHFKSVNDRYGHAFGDTVIIEVAKIISSKITTQDLAVRWGGEEFLIYLAECDEPQAFIIAQSLREAILQNRFKDQQHSVNCTVSIGVYTSNQLISYDTCIDYADIALYQAKQNGRNRVTVYEKQEATA